jgi:tartrate-resistant acid phosphatase type 5
MPGHYYSMDFGINNGHALLRMVFIDTSLPPAEFEKEISFVKNAFADPANQATWRIAVGHFPIRNFGTHGETPKLVSALLPVLQEAHVDLYMAGHDHTQQVIVRNGEPYYIISGGGGGRLYPAPDQHEGLLFSKSAYGFVKVELDGDSMTITYYDDKAETTIKYLVKRDCTGNASSCLQASTDI